MLEVSPEEFITELHITKCDQKKSMILLVEGETDEVLFKSLFKESHIDSILIIPTGNQSTLLQILESINTDPKNSYLQPTAGIADQDYIIPLQKNIPNSNIFLTDYRDIECTMFESPAFARVANEYIDWKKASKLKINDPAKLRDVILSIAEPLGELRYWSQASECHIRFKKLDISKCIDTTKLCLDKTAVINKLNGAQDPGKKVTFQAFADASTARASKSNHFQSRLMICRGHDLCDIFAALLKKNIGQSHSKSADGTTIERSLRLAFPLHWQGYSQINNLISWISNNGMVNALA